jgi:hypothetical protein
MITDPETVARATIASAIRNRARHPCRRSETHAAACDLHRTTP